MRRLSGVRPNTAAKAKSSPTPASRTLLWTTGGATATRTAGSSPTTAAKQSLGTVPVAAVGRGLSAARKLRKEPTVGPDALGERKQAYD